MKTAASFLMFVLALAVLNLMSCCTEREPASGHAKVIQETLPVVLELRTRVIGPDALLVDDGSGSGVVIRADGYLVTCAHVVHGAAEVTVDIGSDRVVATVVAADEFLDLALVHVEHHFDRVATWGDSSSLLVGDFVFDIGFPFDVSRLVSTGCVSSLTLSIRYPVVVTDAAINPGCSGGGLFSYRGELIGIPSALYSAQGLHANTGIAYAIPSNTAHLFVNRNLP